MHKRNKFLIIAATMLGLLVPGSALVKQAAPLEANAVSTTRIYITVTDELLTRSPSGFILHTGSANVTLSVLAGSGGYIYYSDSVPKNAMTFKNNGGSTINLYNISNSGFGTTWDMFTFKANIAATYSDFSGAAESLVTKSVYTPGVQYTVTKYNGATVVGTETAYENVAYVPNDVAVSGYRFKGWYTDSGLTTAYVSTILTANTSLYGKYEAIDLNATYRIFINSTNTWWYNASARVDITFWSSTISQQTLTMTKETGYLHSVVLPNCSFTSMILIRKDPSTGSAWNTTGTIPIDLTKYDVSYLSGPLDNSYATALATSEYKTSDPYITSMQSGVEALSCSNYSNADTLLAAYNALPANELAVVDAKRVTAGTESLTYISVINYYVGWKSAQTPASPTLFARPFDESSWSLLMILFLSLTGLSVLSFIYYTKKKHI